MWEPSLCLAKELFQLLNQSSLSFDYYASAYVESLNIHDGVQKALALIRFANGQNSIFLFTRISHGFLNIHLQGIFSLNNHLTLPSIYSSQMRHLIFFWGDSKVFLKHLIELNAGFFAVTYTF